MCGLTQATPFWTCHFLFLNNSKESQRNFSDHRKIIFKGISSSYYFIIGCVDTENENKFLAHTAQVTSIHSLFLSSRKKGKEGGGEREEGRKERKEREKTKGGKERKKERKSHAGCLKDSCVPNRTRDDLRERGHRNCTKKGER